MSELTGTYDEDAALNYGPQMTTRIYPRSDGTARGAREVIGRMSPREQRRYFRDSLDSGRLPLDWRSAMLGGTIAGGLSFVAQALLR